MLLLDKDEAITATPTFDLLKAHDLGSFAHMLGLTRKQLGYLLYKKDITRNYTSFKILKRNGTERQIKAPNDKLKYLQRNIVGQLSNLREFKPQVTGFVAGRSILDNALFHVDKRFVLNIDLSDFFGSINFGRVYGMLHKPPYNIEKSVAAAIAKAATSDNCLPQGAPTSPILANLICTKLDADLGKLCRLNKCTYSRYADDITISSRMKKFPLAHFESEGEGPSAVVLAPDLIGIVEANGFKINVGKSRLYPREWRQEVTGLVVNERPNVKRTYIRTVRATLHAVEKYGLAAAQGKFEKDFGGKVDLAYRLAGQVSFIGQIRGRNNELYKNLVSRFNKTGMSVKLRTVPTKKELAEMAVWVLESESTAGTNPNQGTAFFLSGYGLITCAHCINDKMVIYHSHSPNIKYKVEVEKIDNDRDIALLTFPKELDTVQNLKMGKVESLNSQDEIWLLGYPNHVPWKPIRSERGSLVRKFPTKSLQYFEITSKVISGNSGGPITDTEFHVVGIARRGITDDTSIREAEYIGISILEIQAFLMPKL